MTGAKQYETDVAIVGGGGAGMAAGIEAREAGARVIAFEKAAEPGGAAKISGGGCLIVGSPFQKKHGIEDTPDLAFKDWIAWGGPSADMVWARYYIEHSLHDLYHWAEGLGVKWVDLKAPGRQFRQPLDQDRAQRPRPDDPPDRRLSRQRRRDRARNRDHQAHDGRRPRHRPRRPQCHDRRADRGQEPGCGDDDRRLQFEPRHGAREQPALRNDKVLVGSGPGSTGSGHKLVREAGGYLTHMDHNWFYVYATPDYRDPAQARGLAFRLVPGYIWVNQQGRRFHNEELSGGNSATPGADGADPAPRLGDHGCADDGDHGYRRSATTATATRSCATR